MFYDINSEIINAAIDETKALLGEYFANTCKQRLFNGAGSRYETIEGVDEMESYLRLAAWVPAEHPDVIPGCTAYRTTGIPGGRFGLVRIADLPDDVKIVASDPKGTGKVSMTVTGQQGPKVSETWLILGPEEVDGEIRQVVYTFHPGEPIRPSMLEVKDCPDGTVLTKAEALALGFELAKVC